MRVRDEVHIDLAIDRGSRGVVTLERRREQGRPCSGGQGHTVRLQQQQEQEERGEEHRRSHGHEAMAGAHIIPRQQQGEDWGVLNSFFLPLLVVLLLLRWRLVPWVWE